jgi:hypothetical protein
MWVQWLMVTLEACAAGVTKTDTGIHFYCPSSCGSVRRTTFQQELLAWGQDKWSATQSGGFLGIHYIIGSTNCVADYVSRPHASSVQLCSLLRLCRCLLGGSVQQC